MNNQENTGFNSNIYIFIWFFIYWQYILCPYLGPSFNHAPLSLFSTPPPLTNFITTPNSSTLNFLDSANTTPILNQMNLLSDSPDAHSVGSLERGSTQSNGVQAAVLIEGAITGGLATAEVGATCSVAPKRKYSEKQLSGKQKKHHYGPVDTFTLKIGTALALSKTSRLETLYSKATQLHNCTGLDVTIIVRDQKTISTHFTNPNTADRIRPLLNNLFDCELIVNKKVAEQNCNIYGKDNNKRIKCFEPTGAKATITLDPE